MPKRNKFGVRPQSRTPKGTAVKNPYHPEAHGTCDFCGAEGPVYRVRGWYRLCHSCAHTQIAWNHRQGV